MRARSIPRSLWTDRTLLWHLADKFRLRPMIALLTRHLVTRSPFGLPPVVILQLTEACNLRCKMCYEWGSTGSQHRDGRSKPASLPLDLVESLLDECAEEKTFFSLFGGEPLLYPGIEKVFERAKRHGSSMETVTNGTLLSKKAALLTDVGADVVRVSLDGPREANDEQRGAGSYGKAMEGLEALYREKERRRKASPLVGVIYTVTPGNCLSLERLFCRDLDLRWVDFVTLQMQTFVTHEMGRAYERFLAREFGRTGTTWWQGMLRDPGELAGFDLRGMLRQFGRVRWALLRRGIPFLLFPNTWTQENLGSYLGARWREMRDWKGHCIAPWVVTDVTARGDVAPCHIFYDLTVGNLKDRGMREIWQGGPFNRFRTHMRRHLLPICPACCQYYGYP